MSADRNPSAGDTDPADRGHRADQHLDGLVADLADGQLAGADPALVLAHLDDCPACRAELADAVVAAAALRDAGLHGLALAGSAADDAADDAADSAAESAVAADSSLGRPDRDRAAGGAVPSTGRLPVSSRSSGDLPDVVAAPGTGGRHVRAVAGRAGGRPPRARALTGALVVAALVGGTGIGVAVDRAARPTKEPFAAPTASATATAQPGPEPPGGVTVQVPLTTTAGKPSRIGAVVIGGQGTGRRMSLWTTGLVPPSAGSVYEVWLDGAAPLAVGSLDELGSGSWIMTAAQAAGRSTVLVVRQRAGATAPTVGDVVATARLA